MLTTSNYSLNKPEGSDVVDISVLNANFDTIDTTMKTLDTKSATYAVTSGSANTYTATISGITNYFAGLRVCVQINTTSTGTSTLNINGLGAKTILDSLGNAISNGGLKANIPYQLCYNGSNFIVLGKGGGGNATASQILLGKTATVDSGQITGTMPDKGVYGQQCTSSTVWNDRVYLRLPEGYYHGGNYDSNGGIAETYAPYSDVANIIGLTPDKMINTATVCGVTGNIDKKIGWQTASNIDSGATSGRLYVYTPSGYYAGVDAPNGSLGVYTDDSNFIASNIISGKSIFGLAGSATIESLGGTKLVSGTIVTGGSQYFNYATSTGWHTATFTFFDISNIGFTPKQIIVTYCDSDITSVGTWTDTDRNMIYYAQNATSNNASQAVNFDATWNASITSSFIRIPFYTSTSSTVTYYIYGN